PDNDDDHWDLIEGQGSLFHPSYSGVTMALIHGGAPDHLVLCHEPTRTHMRGLPHYVSPGLAALRPLAEELARVVNPNVTSIACSINTQHLSDAEAEAYLKKTEDEMGIPCTDPFRYGAGKLVDALP
ncbi:MAG: NAD-dependent epimerase/dehydratase family protein, partial [Pseudomonadota bacterium]